MTQMQTKIEQLICRVSMATNEWLEEEIRVMDEAIEAKPRYYARFCYMVRRRMAKAELYDRARLGVYTIPPAPDIDYKDTVKE
jgi:hypothetical protein